MRGKRGQAAAERKVPGTILREIMKMTLVRCLDDPDPDVRWQARRALECDRCKAGDWRPPADVLVGAGTAEGR